MITPCARFSTEAGALKFIAGSLAPSKYRAWKKAPRLWWVVTAREWSILANVKDET